MCGTLCTHGCRWFDRNYLSIQRFIGTCTGPDIEDTLGITEGLIDSLKRGALLVADSVYIQFLWLHNRHHQRNHL